MRILGVDPGSRATGWAIVEFGAATRLLSAGVLRPVGSFSERLVRLRTSLAAVLVRERPDLAVVERPFAGVNAQSLIALGEARGVLLLALAEEGVPVAELTPAEIKRAVTGSGRAEKEQVRRMVAALLGRRLALDAADAAGAALAQGFRSARRGGTLPSGPAPERMASPAPPGPWRRRPVG